MGVVLKVGRYGSTVYLRETPSGIYHLGVYDPSINGTRWWSLKHDNRERAEQQCHEEHLRLRKGLEALRSGLITLGAIFDLWKVHRMPKRNPKRQKSDARRIELFERMFGRDKLPGNITLREWESFVEERGSGRIDARGVAHCGGSGVRQEGAGGDHRRDPRRGAGLGKPAVRPRTIAADLIWLNTVLNWATKWRTESGYLLDANPLRGYPIPVEKNPRRAVATTDRYERIMEVAMSEARGEAVACVKVPDKRPGQGSGNRTVASGRTTRPRFGYLAELLPLAAWTGRRISAICALRYDDLRLSGGPYGSIRWRADTDKAGRESVVPMAPEARRAIDRVLAQRPGIGAHPLFPAPKDPSKPMSRFLANSWLRKAEKAAGLAHLDGTTWHAYRRLFATARKHLPEPDVMRAGGWRDSRSFEVYQQHDQSTLQKVVSEPMRLEEAR